MVYPKVLFPPNSIIKAVRNLQGRRQLRAAAERDSQQLQGVFHQGLGLGVGQVQGVRQDRQQDLRDVGMLRRETAEPVHQMRQHAHERAVQARHRPGLPATAAGLGRHRPHLRNHNAAVRRSLPSGGNQGNIQL